jgi:hypothetical protein
MLDFDAGRPVLVTLAQSGPDYDTFGCPTPPYIIFRYEAGTWGRIPLAELPRSLVRMNLYPDPDADLLKTWRYFLTPTATLARYQDVREDNRHTATIDRRFRNPLAYVSGMGCSAGAVERIYGVGKYDEWKNTGSWLDKSEAEALHLLRRKGETTTP